MHMTQLPILPPNLDTLAGPAAPDRVVIRSDLLPPRTHGSNLRGIMSQTVWNALRFPVNDAAGGRCQICGDIPIRNGKQTRTDCHEKWAFEYQGPHPVQRLVALVALCPGCHEVQHSGRARVQGRERDVIQRLQRLNGWTYQQAIADLERSSERCRLLDTIDWNLDLRALTGRISVEGHPTLQIPAASRASLGNSYFRALNPA
jgi:hypothetical protein